MDGIVKHEAGLTAHPGQGMGQLVELFLKSQDIAESSKATYRRYLRMFSAWIQENPQAAAGGQYTRETILEYKKALGKSGQGFTAATVSNAIGAVRCFFTWAESMAYYPNIAKGVKGEKRNRKKHLKGYFTPEQSGAILAAIDRGTLEGGRDYAIINLMFRLGLREIEICRANIGDMDRIAGTEVLNILGKGQDEKEWLALPPAALGPIREYLGRRGPAPDDAPLFISHGPTNRGLRLTTRIISRIFTKYKHKAGIISNKLTAHSCRHSAVTFALLAGASIQEAQAFARHSDINTTLIYAHNVDREKNITKTPEFKIDAFLNQAQGGGL